MDQSILNIITTIIAVAGAIAGTIVGVILTNNTTLKREKRKITREKCQEIFELFLQINRWLDNENSRWWKRFDEDVTIFPPISDTLECPIDNFLMLVILYTPQLEKLALELNTMVKRIEADEWEYRDSGTPSTNNMPLDDFLRGQSKEYKEFERKFTSKMKRFIAQI